MAFMASRRTLRMATLPSSPSLLTVLVISLRRSCRGLVVGDTGHRVLRALEHPAGTQLTANPGQHRSCRCPVHPLAPPRKLPPI